MKAMQTKIRFFIPLILSLTLALIAACDPLMPVVAPTAEVIIVTSPPTITPIATITPISSPTQPPTPTDLPTPTATPLPCRTDGGQLVEILNFRSEIAGELLRYRVYLPPCYFQTQKRYPVAYLLHGASNNERQWTDISTIEALDQGIELGALAPMVVVMPYTGVVGNRNTFPPDPSYEDVVLDELMPAIERDFCTINNRENRAIGGISRGGFWAFSISLRHPDLFSIIGGHSASFDAGNAPPANNPLDLALNASFITDTNLRISLDNGASDFVGPNLELFSSRLSSRGINHDYTIHPVGDHDDAYWSAHISEYLDFYTADWTTDDSALPSCLEPSP
jgi:enterochelin esterase-like enzyme